LSYNLSGGPRELFEVVIITVNNSLLPFKKKTVYLFCLISKIVNNNWKGKGIFFVLDVVWHEGGESGTPSKKKAAESLKKDSLPASGWCQRTICCTVLQSDTQFLRTIESLVTYERKTRRPITCFSYESNKHRKEGNFTRKSMHILIVLS
jgi:hypothetical protein